MADQSIPGLHISNLAADLRDLSRDFMAQDLSIMTHQSRRGFHDKDRLAHARRPDPNLCVHGSRGSATCFDVTGPPDSVEAWLLIVLLLLRWMELAISSMMIQSVSASHASGWMTAVKNLPSDHPAGHENRQHHLVSIVNLRFYQVLEGPTHPDH